MLIAKQAGHSLAMLLSTYAHLIDEYAGRERVDPEVEITAARAAYVRSECAEQIAERG